MTSPSQKALRAAIAVASVGLAVLTTVVAPGGSLVAALVVVGLTPFVVLDPASRLTTVLLALQAGNWLMSVPVPAGLRDWLAVLVASVALTTIHLAAALASAFPAAAAVPGATLRRWMRRSATVLGLSVPVWLLLAAQSEAAPEGDAVLTYAALAALALLAFGFWRAGARPTVEQPASSARTPGR